MENLNVEKCYVYCIDEDGSYCAPIEENTIEGAARTAATLKGLFHEIRVVDISDIIIIQVIKGELVYPELS